MEITKVGTLGKDETEVLVAAGKVLRTVKDSLEGAAIDTLSDQDLELLVALETILADVAVKLPK